MRENYKFQTFIDVFAERVWDIHKTKQTIE